MQFGAPPLATYPAQRDMTQARGISLARQTPSFVVRGPRTPGSEPVVSGAWRNIGRNSTVTCAGTSWSLHCSGRPETIQQDAIDPTLFRFTVQPGDFWSVDGTSKNRAEFRRLDNFAFDTDHELNYWIHFGDMARPSSSITDTNNGWLIIGQAHHTEDAGDSQGLSPPWMREINYTRAHSLKHRTSQTDPLLVNPSSTTDYTTEVFRYNRWVRVREQHRFDPDGGTGYHRVWYDGLHVSDYSGNTAYVDAIPPYYKIGIYRYADPEVTHSVMIQGMSVV